MSEGEKQAEPMRVEVDVDSWEGVQGCPCLGPDKYEQITGPKECCQVPGSRTVVCLGPAPDTCPLRRRAVLVVVKKGC